jgi:hypothetical protein
VSVDLTAFRIPKGDLKPMESAGRVLAELGRDLVEDMSQPAARAGFGASLLTSALLARARMGFIPTIAIAVMIGVSVEHLYAMAEDIHGTAIAQQDYLAVLTAKAAADATSEV